MRGSRTRSPTIPIGRSSRTSTGRKRCSWSAEEEAISIRLDEDVLDYFKKEGAGYQRRMNAVLRSDMQQTRNGKKRA